ncbi:MAG: hypothetical protein JWM58_2892 [Rhizobium sp.]|nr:hypothetical protein [Rhizobium sp.]
MSLRFIFVVSWALPVLMLAWILYHERTTLNQPVIETNSKMRIRMCREHIDTAKADPADTLAKQAVDDCVTAGYISKDEIKTAID